MMRGCGSSENQYSRIMLRFRPIAPKPSDASDLEMKRSNVGVRRIKRKYVRQRKQSQNIVTLQLLPESRSETRSSESSSDGHKKIVSYRSKAKDGGGTMTWISVECVHTGLGDGVSDRDKISSLEADTCPGFVSDASNNVVWVNEAYTNLVAPLNNTCLLLKHKLPYLAPSFACTLRMIHQTKHGHKWNAIVPCDVSRMDNPPGFAWKLDLNTALGLRLSPNNISTWEGDK